MTDNPGNGTRRFDDLARHVDTMDSKLDKHGELLARIAALLEARPCVLHDSQIRDLQARQTRTEAGMQISVAKVTGLAGIVAAVVSSIGAYFVARGGN